MTVNRKHIKIACITCFILIFAFLLGLPVYILRNHPDIILAPLFAPQKIDYSIENQNYIRTNLGIKPPDMQHLVEGYVFPSRDPAYVFIFEYEFPSAPDGAAAEDFLRNALELGENHSIYPVESIDAPWFAEIGYEFTHQIKYKVETPAWGDIFYRISGNKIVMGLWWGYP